MYTLYHIKGKKWGCSEQLEQRLLKQGYTIDDCDRIITCGNIDKASDMERDLNIEYGYGWNDSQYYKRVIEMAKIGGEKLGKLMKENGTILKAQKISALVRKGKKMSEESRIKMSIAAKLRSNGNNQAGRQHSEESRIKMSIAAKLRWDKIKQK